jgi:hypothetical protein
MADEVGDEASTEGSQETALVPVREQVVDFYGDPIPVAEDPAGELYVPLRPLVEFLGLDIGAARRRVARDEVLAARSRQVRMTGSDGRQRTFLSLPLDLLPGWLFGIETSRVRPELAPKLTRYRAECFRVLWQAFKTQVLPAEPPATGLSGAALALEIAEAIAGLARQQLDLEQRYTTMADYMRGHVRQTNAQLREHAGQLADHNERLEVLELHLSAAATISEAQAAELALVVKTVAAALEARGERNGYQRVYGELYRRYNIGAYRNLPAARYEEALTWLRGWYDELAGPPTDRIKES